MIRVFSAMVLIALAGLVHGAWTNRWHPSAALAALRTRFDSVPMVIGEWHGTAIELPAEDRARAGVVACLARRYSSPIRGVSVSVLLFGGLPGGISAHTPDACYPASGYTLDSPSVFQRRDGRDGHRAEFRTALATRGGRARASYGYFGVGTPRKGGWPPKSRAGNSRINRRCANCTSSGRPGGRSPNPEPTPATTS